VKIVIAEKISAAAVDQLREPGWVVLTSDRVEGKLTTELESADALIVRSAVQADAALLAHAKKLRVIGRAGVGVDNIDLDAAHAPGHRGNEHSRGKCGGGGGTSARHDAGHGSSSMPRGCPHACR